MILAYWPKSPSAGSYRPGPPGVTARRHRPVSLPGLRKLATQRGRDAFAACLLPGQAKRAAGTRCLKAPETLGGLSGTKRRDATGQAWFASIGGEL